MSQCFTHEPTMHSKPQIFGALLAVGVALASLQLPAAPADDAAKSSAPRLPTVFLIGDSTVKNGSGKGDGGLWGWGAFLGDHFDGARVRIENRALGGRSSRTYLTEGLWDKVLADLRRGDFVLMQFGHNDGGELATGRARASLKGNGNETREVTLEKTGAKEVVHTYGWYLRHYIEGAKAKGATAIVLSPVPRNIWKDGKIGRASNDYGKWAAEAARDGGALFIDLNELVARRYEAAGQPKVAADFFTAADHTHTTRAGAQVNAAAVAEGVHSLSTSPLPQCLKASPK